MNHIDYPVFQQLLNELEHYPTLFYKLEKMVEEQDKNFNMNITEIEFDYKTQSVKIYNVLMALDENNPHSFCQLPINDFFEILITERIKKKEKLKEK